MSCLYCKITALVGSHIAEQQDRGQLIDLVPIVRALGSALGTVIAAGNNEDDRLHLTAIASDAIGRGIAVAADRPKAPGQPAARSVN